ncbi:MAG: C45 family peptidase [Anaerolineae bacterium]|nr:C45 family peptidase [Thermoflexales bacterium]MDW8407882.1 C45 family peptidase [Anaerolineae bacterium]
MWKYGRPLDNEIETPDYRFFDLAGTHAELGYLLGRNDPPFTMQPWWAPPAAPSFTRACAAVVRALHPPLMDEFEAYADAQHRDADSLWQQCCRVDLKARFRMGPEGCSTFAWHRRGRAVIGRNYDYWPMQARRQRIRFVPSASGPSNALHASVGARGGAPCGRYDGFNQAGLFVSLHVVMTDAPERVAPGVPFHLVGRLALERCQTARQAVDLLTHIPHLSSLNYLLADPTQAFVVEADPRRVRVREETSNGALAATNHFQHPDMRPLQGRRSVRHSACRASFLSTQPAHWLDDAHTVDELLDIAQAVMADRSAPVCGVDGALATLWSWVAELSTRRIRYAPGAPHVTPFVEVPL